MSKIIWLASYPKSGNTWLRVFLTNYCKDTAVPASINALDIAPIASSRASFEELVGVDAADLTPAQIENCRPMVYRLLAELGKETRYLKVHDAYQKTPAGDALFPADATQGVLYLVRHPCDVAVSYAHHNNVSLDHAIEFMANPDAVLAPGADILQVQLEQKVSTWSGHVCSWLESPLPHLVLRYEDMLADPQRSFGAALRFAGITEHKERLVRAIEFSSFEELQAQEANSNFSERQPHAPSFFRRGKAGTWRETLTDAQVNALVTAHSTIMRRFGYLDAHGNVV